MIRRMPPTRIPLTHSSNAGITVGTSAPGVNRRKASGFSPVKSPPLGRFLAWTTCDR